MQGRKKMGYLPRKVADALSTSDIKNLNRAYDIEVTHIGYKKDRVRELDIHIKER